MSRGLLVMPFIGKWKFIDLFDTSRPRGHYDQLFAEKERLLDRVRDQDDRLAGFLPQLQNKALHLFPGEGIQRAERFVHQDHIRIIGEAAGKRDTLLHAAGKLVNRLFSKILQAHSLQQVLDLFPGLGFRFSGHVRPEGDVFLDGQPFEQGALLKDHAAFGARSRDGMVVQTHLTRSGRQEPGNYVEERCLATAGRSEDGDDFAFLDIKADIVERMDLPAARQREDH